jgi:hypothetical protein
MSTPSRLRSSKDDDATATLCVSPTAAETATADKDAHGTPVATALTRALTPHP